MLGIYLQRPARHPHWKNVAFHISSYQRKITHLWHVQVMMWWLYSLWIMWHFMEMEVLMTRWTDWNDLLQCSFYVSIYKFKYMCMYMQWAMSNDKVCTLSSLCLSLVAHQAHQSSTWTIRPQCPLTSYTDTRWARHAGYCASYMPCGHPVKTANLLLQSVYSGPKPQSVIFVFNLYF